MIFSVFPRIITPVVSEMTQGKRHSAFLFATSSIGSLPAIFLAFFASYFYSVQPSSVLTAKPLNHSSSNVSGQTPGVQILAQQQVNLLRSQGSVFVWRQELKPKGCVFWGDFWMHLFCRALLKYTDEEKLSVHMSLIHSYLHRLQIPTSFFWSGYSASCIKLYCI